VNDDAQVRLCRALGHDFADPTLLRRALTHRSFVNEARTDAEDNERLEFLGDAVLDLAVSEALMARFPEADEGQLSRMRAWLVSEVALARVAVRIGLGPAMALGRGEALSGGREKASLLADAFEAVVAALYLDAGMDAVRRLVSTHFDLASTASDLNDPKSTLQQRLQATHRLTPSYRLAAEEGPDHDKLFTAEVWLGDQRLGTGLGRSKKEAEQRAAAGVLAELDRGESSA
jgi:ribonuclease-3